MSWNNEQQGPDRELLRSYLVDTLPDAQRERVEASVEQEASWREALESERKNLALLDALPEVTAPDGLADSAAKRALAMQPGPQERRRRLALTAASALAVLMLLVAIGLPALARSREAARRASSQNNLKQMGIIMKMYSIENRDKFPPMAPYEGIWIFDVEKLYPKYITDLSILVNPGLPAAQDLHEALQEAIEREPKDWEQVCRIAAQSYVYTNWVIMNQEEAAIAVQARKQLATTKYDDDLTAADTTLPRPREGVERFLITDINNAAATNVGQSTIPIIFESPAILESRRGKTIDVLYMDGHVEPKKLNEGFPATEEVLRLFAPASL